MAKGRIRLLSTIPGPANLSPIVREFCRKEGVLTAFSDSAIKVLAGMVPEESGSEALALGALARRFASLCGEMPLPVAHDGHAEAAIGVACEGLSSDSPFFRTAQRAGLHRALLQTLHELADFGLRADDYEGLSLVAEEDLPVKLESLAEIERGATETLGMLGRSFSRDHFRMCLDGKLEAGAKLGRIFVLAGSEFSPQAVDLIRWAVHNGADVTVTTYRPASDVDLFAGARRTASALGMDPEISGNANSLLSHLFAVSTADSSDLRSSIVSASDPLAEVEWALRGCLERNRAGMPYPSIALYVRDLESYAPLIEASAKRLNVPLRMWRRAPLMTNSFARITQSALEFCASSDVRSLMPLARTSYLGLDHGKREVLFQALKEAHSGRDLQWARLREWSSTRTEEYGWLGKLLDWRDASITSPLPLEAWIGRLRDLLPILPIQQTASGGDERDKRAAFVLQQSLNQIASVRRVRNPMAITLREFSIRAQAIWAESDVSLPAGERGLLVTSQSEALPELRCLFVLGMLEGVFPRRRTEDPILSDFEREAIDRVRGGEQLPSSRDKAQRERDEFYTVCATASEEIVFSYPETDEDRDNVPAFYLEEVKRALGGIDQISRVRSQITPREPDCLATSDREIRRALDEARAESVGFGFTNRETVLSLVSPKDTPRSPRELKEALLCPFSFFAKRTLAIRPERLRSRWFSLVRLPDRAHLATASGPEEARRNLEQELESHLDSLYSEIPYWEIALLRSGGRRLIREWVDREFAARDTWPRSMTRTEVFFGEKGLQDRLPRSVTLKGKVPAMSRCEPYSVVHLVETGGPAKTYGPANDLADQDRLYYGLHLLASWDKSSSGALEIETMSGERYLMLMPRLPGVNLPGKLQKGLRVIDLAGPDEAGGPRAFFDEVKRLADEAASRIAEVDVRAIKGDHCAWCDYGELCRRSMEFGEEDSPFVEDL